MLDSTAHDVSEFGSKRATLVWAVGPNGKIAHISEVANGIKCGCRCPDKNCKEALIARTNHETPHFAHTANKACNGGGPETAIHLLAKEAIADHKKLFLREQRASFKQVTELVRPEGIVEFDSVVLEDRAIDDIIPDVVAFKGGRPLLVEIAVTHPCDSEKIVKIRANGVAAIEIDLSGLPRRVDRAAIAQAVIYDARRHWLFHPDIDARLAKLKKDHENREANAKKAFLDTVDRFIRDYSTGFRNTGQRPPPEMPDYEVLRAAQLLDHIGVQVDGRGSFTWSLAEWQLYIIRHAVLSPKTFNTKALRNELRAAGAIRPMFQFVPKEIEEALESRAIGFLSPYKAIETYLKHLTDCKALLEVRYGDGYKQRGYKPTGEILDRIAKHSEKLERIEQRLQTVSDTVQAVLNGLPSSERNTCYAEAWMQLEQPEFGLSFANAIQTDDARFPGMLAKLRRIERMFFNDAAIPESTLRLPIEAECERRRESKARAARDLAAQKSEAEEQSRLARIARIKAAAESDLGEQAAAWLESVALDGATPVSAAALHSEGLQSALSALQALVDKRNAQIKAQNVIDGFVRQLWEQAQQMLGERAPYFMRSPYPEIGGKRPDQFCTDKVTLTKCLELLKAVAKKR